MTEMGSAGTLGGLLASRRRRRFVESASEAELFWAALDMAEPPRSMLYQQRPGGVGRTRLLDGLAGPAADTGASVPDDLPGKGPLADGIDLLGALVRV